MVPDLHGGTGREVRSLPRQDREIARCLTLDIGVTSSGSLGRRAPAHALNHR